MIPTGKRGNVQHLKPIKRSILMEDGEVQQLYQIL
jgi:hypothetical protein